MNKWQYLDNKKQIGIWALKKLDKRKKTKHFLSKSLVTVRIFILTP